MVAPVERPVDAPDRRATGVRLLRGELCETHAGMTRGGAAMMKWLVRVGLACIAAALLVAPYTAFHERTAVDHLPPDFWDVGEIALALAGLIWLADRLWSKVGPRRPQPNR